MAVQLSQIKNYIDKFASTISKILDLDVMIIDSGLRQVSNVLRYYDQRFPVRRSSVVSRCIKTGEVVVIQDRRKLDSCRRCPESDICEMRGLIAVPILYREEVVGAIALIIPKQKVNAIFRDVDNSVEFLQNMAALISSRIQESSDYATLETVKQEREILMDQIEYAVASTDDLGRITYHNRRFLQTFHQKGSCVGRPLYDIVPAKLISECLTRQTWADNRPLVLENGVNEFCGLVTCKQMTTLGRPSGAMFLFKPARQICSDFADLTPPSGQAGFDVCGDWFSRAVLEQAARTARNREHLLLRGESGTGKKLLAQCIHNGSERGHFPLRVVDCADPCAGREEPLIFGELGCLQTAHRSSVLLENVEGLSRHLQERLERFLSDGILIHNGVRHRLDVRVICSTAADLEERAERDRFSSALARRLNKHAIHLTPLREDPALLRRVVDHSLELGRVRYRKPSLSLTPAARDALCRLPWPGNIRQAEGLLDEAARRFDGPVGPEDLEQLTVGAAQGLSLKETERARIEEMLARGCPKQQIAQELGISKATLYRKLKAYETEKNNAPYF